MFDDMIDEFKPSNIELPDKSTANIEATTPTKPKGWGVRRRTAPPPRKIGKGREAQPSIEEVKNFPVMESAEDFEKENDEGYVEYKWKLIDKDPHRVQKLATQMQYRLTEGNGEAIYRLGVQDNGFSVGLGDEDLGRSLHTLRTVARVLETNKVFCRVDLHHVAKGAVGKVAEVRVLRLQKERKVSEDPGTDQQQLADSDIRICCTGGVGSGKSTLIGVLTTGELDDGEGLARQEIFQHLHELKHGTTSAISRHLLGFDEHGEVTNKSDFEGNDWDDQGSDWSQILESSNKVVTFIDLAGHEGYMKTTLYGLVSQFPDYILVAVAADKGVSSMTKQHLSLGVALQVPLLVVCTRIDLADVQTMTQTIQEVEQMLKKSDKIPVLVVATGEGAEKEAGAAVAAGITARQSLTPIFCVSSVTGKGLATLRACLNGLRCSNTWVDRSSEASEFFIDSVYEVVDVGTVVHGTLVNGEVAAKMQLLLGPDHKGLFRPVTVTSLHVKKTSAAVAEAGQAATIALHEVQRSEIRKGMVLIHPSLQPRPSRGFDAKIRLLHHRTAIRNDHEVIVIFGTAMQATRMVDMHPSILRTGESGVARFIFNCHPEYIKPGLTFIFRSGHSRGVGEIMSALTFDPTKRPFVRSKPTRRKLRRETA